MTWARRTDANLTAIVEELRRLGLSVHVLNDVVDLVVGYGGLSMLVEVKDGAKPPSRRQLTPAQLKFRETWTGGIRLVTCLQDARETASTLQRWHLAVSHA